MSGPGDQARLAKLLQAVMVGRMGLLGIGRDDLEIVFFAEGEKSILRSASWMDAAECGAHAGVLGDEIDAAIENAAAEKYVIEHGGRPFFPGRKHRARVDSGGGKSRDSCRNKLPSRNCVVHCVLRVRLPRVSAGAIPVRGLYRGLRQDR